MLCHKHGKTICNSSYKRPIYASHEAICLWTTYFAVFAFSNRFALRLVVPRAHALVLTITCTKLESLKKAKFVSIKLAIKQETSLKMC